MEKKTKAEVDYGPGYKRGDHCAICRYYRMPNKCELVQGHIDPLGWCKLFEKKEKK